MKLDENAKVLLRGSPSVHHVNDAKMVYKILFLLLLVIVILDASSYVAFYQLIVDLLALVNSCLHVCLQGNMLRIFTRGGITQQHCIDTEVVTVLQVNFALTKLQFQYCRSSP